MTARITQLDMRVIERVLDTGRGVGYVLDFSDADFSGFFADFGVNIDDPHYSTDGGSKGKRLRTFLRTTQSPLVGRVLAELLKHRLLNGKAPLPEIDRAEFTAIAARLGGVVPSADPQATPASEDELLKLIFQPATFEHLAVDAEMSKLLISRMEEASRCVENRAFLAGIILCGSVLEGMCLGYGVQNPEAVNRGYVAQYSKAAPPFYDWKLAEWIGVLGRLQVLSQNVMKFGTALRDFRNYVHPSEQLARKFEPDKHTARIGFQVVVAAAEDLVKAGTR